MKTAGRWIIGTLLLALGVLAFIEPTANAESNAHAQQRVQAEETRRQEQAYDAMRAQAAKAQDEWNTQLTQQIAQGEAVNARLRQQNEEAARQALAAWQRQQAQAPKIQPPAVNRPAPLRPPPGLQGQALRDWVKQLAAAKLRAAGYAPR